MAWPSNVTRTYLDQGSDDPAQARAELDSAIQAINEIINNLGTGVGNIIQLEDVGSGVAGLPAVDGSQLTNVGSGDEKVAARSTDSTPDYLNNKTSASAPVYKQILNANGDEVVNFYIGSNSISAGYIATDGVGNSEIAANAVRTSEIYWGSGTVGGGSGTYALPGGAYGLWPRMTTTAPSSGSVVGASLLPMYLTQDAASSWKYAANTGTYSSYAARISIYRTSSSASAYFNQYYVRSSPPYDFGDGEIAGTLFAEVDANGAVIRMYSADAPPWINNGPTNCRADFTTKNGKKYQIVRVGHRVREGLKRGKVTPEVALRTVRKHYADEPSIVKKLRLGQISIDQFLNDSRAHRCLGTHVIEIDHGVKNADMPILPQPFEGNNPKRTILVDPMDTRVRDLLDLQDDGENVIDYFLDGAIRVDNEPLKRHGPPGVMAVKMKL